MVSDDVPPVLVIVNESVVVDQDRSHGGLFSGLVLKFHAISTWLDVRPVIDLVTDPEGMENAVDG